MHFRILIVEDEPELRLILRDNLEVEGYEVLCADTGESALTCLAQQRVDLLLLDLMLPQMSGYDVCRKIRAKGLDLPILMLTARNTEFDRIAGLDVGADDYIGKPFQIGELLARIRAHLRRLEQTVRGDASREVKLGDVTVDLGHQAVKRGNKHIQVSAREFDLLRYLIDHSGEVVTREQLLAEVWGYHDQSLTRTVDNFIAKLRKHIDDPSNPRHVLTVHGAGYRFVM